MFDVPHAMFQSWLILKKQAVGTEQEALDRVLSSRIPRNIPKKRPPEPMTCQRGMLGMLPSIRSSTTILVAVQREPRARGR